MVKLWTKKIWAVYISLKGSRSPRGRGDIFRLLAKLGPSLPRPWIERGKVSLLQQNLLPKPMEADRQTVRKTVALGSD